jgi:hypothetical protein
MKEIVYGVLHASRRTVIILGANQHVPIVTSDLSSLAFAMLMGIALGVRNHSWYRGLVIHWELKIGEVDG